MSDVLDSFIFYRSFREAVADLDTEDQLVTLLAICDYALYGVEPDLKGVPKAIFTLAKPNLDANVKRRKNGKNSYRDENGVLRCGRCGQL